MDGNLTINVSKHENEVPSKAHFGSFVDRFFSPIEESPWREYSVPPNATRPEGVLRIPYSLSLLAAWQPRHAMMYISFSLLIIVVLFLRVINIVIRQLFTSAFPECLVAIFFGSILGYVFKLFELLSWELTPTLFFMVILPFCITDAAYHLYNRAFADCVLAIISYALFATILNTIFIGILLVMAENAGFFKSGGLEFGTQVLMLYASLIAAVDPVAVLNVFQEIGVDPNLYYLVLGESLLNDAVTVALYKIVVNFLGRHDVNGHDILVGIAAFFIINAGGILVGLVFGALSCIMTRIQTHLEVVFLFIANYSAYLLSDILGWSGLVAMITSGMIQSSYAFHNLTPEASDTCRSMARMMADVCETVTFLLIGIQLTSEELRWHSSFVLYQLFVCLVVRIIVVFGLTWCLNKYDVNYSRITLTEQFVLAYGGLRGAVALSLVYMVDPKKVDRGQKGVHSTLVTATLFTILFTVVAMGPTMKPLVRLLRVKLASKKKISLMKELNERIIDEINSGVEVITGHMGWNRLRAWFQRLDEKYIRKVLQNQPEFKNEKIVKVYEDMALVLHQASLNPKRADEIMAELPTSVKAAYHAQRLADKAEALRQLKRRRFRHPSKSSYDFQSVIDDKRRTLWDYATTDSLKSLVGNLNPRNRPQNTKRHNPSYLALNSEPMLRFKRKVGWPQQENEQEKITNKQKEDR